MTKIQARFVLGIIVSGWFLGLVTAGYLEESSVVGFLFLALVGLLAGLSVFIKTGHRLMTMSVILFFGFCGWGYYPFGLSWYLPVSDQVAGQGQWEGEVIGFPDRGLTGQSFIIKEKRSNFNFWVKADLYPVVRLGDKVKIIGYYQPPVRPFADNDFNDYSYLRTRDLSGRLYAYNLEIIKKTERISVLAWWRQKIIGGLKAGLPEPHASLATGVLMGDRSGFASEIRKHLQQAGLIHLTVVSGYHVGLVAGLVAVLASYFITTGWRPFFVLILVGFFILMTGPATSAIRAGLMVSLAMMAGWWGRPYAGLRALFYAVFLMTVIKPVIIFDIGFQLSVAATWGVLVLTPIIVNCLLAVFSVGQKTKIIFEIMAVSIAAQVAVMPLLLIWTGDLSWLAPFSNILLSPWMVFILPALALLAFLNMIGTGLALLPATISWLWLEAVLRVSAMMGILTPEVSWRLPVWSVFIFYPLLWFVSRYLSVKYNPQWSWWFY
ncbi:MAG: ComEC/Rec2 family competence protein [Patescibacteria group bacterium]